MTLKFTSQEEHGNEGSHGWSSRIQDVCEKVLEDPDDLQRARQYHKWL